MCTNFQAKRTTLTFLAQICPKMDLRSEIQKTSVGIRISIVKMPCVPMFRKKGTILTFSTQICSKMDFGVGQNFKNPDSESALPRYHVCQFSVKTDNFDIFGPNLPKYGFSGWNFKYLSLDSESTPPIYHVRQFSVKMDNF